MHEMGRVQRAAQARICVAMHRYGAEAAPRHAKMHAETWGRCWAAHSIALMTVENQSCLLKTQVSPSLMGSHYLIRSLAAARDALAHAMLSMSCICILPWLDDVDLDSLD